MQNPAKLSELVVLAALGLALLPLAAKLSAESEEDLQAALSAEKLIELIEEAIQGSGSPAGILSGLDRSRADSRTLRAIRTLQTTRLSLQIKDQDLETVLNSLRQISGLDFIISPKAREALAAAPPELDLDLKDATLEEVLNLIALQLSEFRFQLRYGIVQLLHREEYRPEVILRFYPVHDLIRPRQDFKAPRLGLTPSED